MNRLADNRRSEAPKSYLLARLPRASLMLEPVEGDENLYRFGRSPYASSSSACWRAHISA